MPVSDVLESAASEVSTPTSADIPPSAAPPLSGVPPPSAGLPSSAPGTGSNVSNPSEHALDALARSATEVTRAQLNRDPARTPEL